MRFLDCARNDGGGFDLDSSDWFGLDDFFLDVEHFFEGFGGFSNRFNAFFIFPDITFGRFAFGHKLVDSTHSVDKFLSTGDEGVAFVTDIYVEGGAGAANGKSISASTGNDHFEIVWVKILFHSFCILSREAKNGKKRRHW